MFLLIFCSLNIFIFRVFIAEKGEGVSCCVDVFGAYRLKSVGWRLIFVFFVVEFVEYDFDFFDRYFLISSVYCFLNCSFFFEGNGV